MSPIVAIGNIDNPVHKCENKNNNVEMLSNDKDNNCLMNKKIDCVSTTSAVAVNKESENLNEKEIVENLNNSYRFSSVITRGQKMAKQSRNLVSGDKEAAKSIPDQKKTARKSMPGKIMTRKVLAEKQMNSSNQISLRSYRRKGTSLLRDNLLIKSRVRVSIENGTEIAENMKTNLNDVVQTQRIENKCKKTILKESGENSDPLSLGSKRRDADELRTKKDASRASLPLMEQILIEKNEILDNIRNQVQTPHRTIDSQSILNNKQKSLTNGNVIEPKERVHRRKCSEPLKTERIQTRRSRSITLMQNNNEYKYFSQVPKTVECVPYEADKTLEAKLAEEEYTIICTPDININDCLGETSSDESKKSTNISFDTQNNNELLGTNGDQRALNFTKSTPVKEIEQEDDCKKPDTNSSAPMDLTITPYGSNCSKVLTGLTKKRCQGNQSGSPKRQLRHVTAQAMPFYVSKIAVSRNENIKKSLGGESLLLSQSRKKVDKSSDLDRDEAEKKEKSSAQIGKKTEIFSNNISPFSGTEKTIDSKNSYLSNTDSEETLSNVESVPNSPAQETWAKATGQNFKFNNKRVKFNSGPISSCRRDTISSMRKMPAGVNHRITEKEQNVEVKSVEVGKYSKNEISTLKYNTKKVDFQPRYYVDASTNQNPFCTTDNGERKAGNDNVEQEQTTPWLRHFERPQKTHTDTAAKGTELEDKKRESIVQQNQILYQQQKQNNETIKKTSGTSITDNSASKHHQAGKGYTRTNRSKQHSQPGNSQPLKKRGRPRKEDTQDSETKSTRNRRSHAGGTADTNERTNGPSASGAAPNGSGLSKLELEFLLFKFLQHGHFRIEPRQPTIITHNNDWHQNFTGRMYCNGPNEYFTHPHNIEAKNNSMNEIYSHLQQNFPNDGSGYYPSNNFSSGQFEHNPGTLNPNSWNFSHQHGGQTIYSRNLSPSKVNTNIPSHKNYSDAEINKNRCSGIASTNSVPSSTQSGYDIASNYHQNFYNNNTNEMGNNLYSNTHSGIMNSNDSMNNMNTGTQDTNLLSITNNSDNDFNFFLNTQTNQHQNLIPWREIDLTMSNQNTASSNSMDSVQNSPASNSNVNSDWNLSNVNQSVVPVNGPLGDLNSLDHAYEASQAIGPDLNNLVNNPNHMTNSSIPWMNRSNNMMNPRFPVLQQWHASLPMYNSYLNNGNRYYNNMLNPYTYFTGFDLPNYPYSNMNARNSIGINNANPWVQNIPSGIDANFPINVTNSEFSNMNSDSFLENSTNQGLNLSLLSNTVMPTTLPQTNLIEVDNTNLALNHNIEQMKGNTLAQVETNNNDIIQQSARAYSKQIYVPYPLEYENDRQNHDFDDVKMVNTDDNYINDQQQNLPQIQDHINQRLDSFEACFNRDYRPTNSPNCEIITELPNIRETEISKLRQELADFTRQYSENQTSPTLSIPQGDEIFSCMMTQNLEADRNPI